jgi:hypothetical protein
VSDLNPSTAAAGIASTDILQSAISLADLDFVDDVPRAEINLMTELAFLDDVPAVPIARAPSILHNLLTTPVIDIGISLPNSVVQSVINQPLSQLANLGNDVSNLLF